MANKKKFIIGGAIILVAVISLAVSGFQKSASYYYTVSEAVEQGTVICGENLRVNGFVVPDSVISDIKNLTLKFTITEGGQTLPIVFKGVTPDNFGPDADVVVGGVLDSSGVLQADSILTKCPSKYEAQ